MSFLKTESFSEGLKPGDKIQNVHNKKVATVTKVYAAGVDFAHEGCEPQFLNHGIVNLYWVRVRE